MTESRIAMVVPCRAGSKRVQSKNTRPFLSFQHGLLELKLRQLDQVKRLDHVFVSTNDSEVEHFVLGFAEKSRVPVVLDRRPEEYAQDDSLQGLVDYLIRVVDADVIAWTHVTSPLFGAELYAQALDQWEGSTRAGSHDSLMSVNVERTFALRGSTWISHDRSIKRWPRTQDLEPLNLVNSALFVAAKSVMAEHHDRIGNRPWLFETPGLRGFDVDWEEDFSLAETLYQALESPRPLRE